MVPDGPGEQPSPPLWPAYAALVLSVVTLIVVVLMWREVRASDDDIDRLLCVERASINLPAPAPADAYVNAIEECVR